MTTTKSKLVAALKKRFSSPGDVLRRLGLDADLLAPQASGGNSDAVKAMRVEIENLLGELHLDETQIKQLLEVLDKHASFTKLDDSDPHAPRARELAGKDDDETLAKFRALLRKCGLSDADIDEALNLARSGENGEATDYLPANGLPSSGGFGGRLSGARAQPQPAMDERLRASAIADFDRRFGGAFSRITVGFDHGRGRPRPALGPSQKTLDDFHRLYPDAARIG